MKNSNVVWVSNFIEEVRRWIEYEVPGDREDSGRARDVDDLVQKVCLIAVEKLGGNHEDLGKAGVRAWLRKTCQNVVKGYRYKLFVEIGRFERRDVVELELPRLRTQPDEEALRCAIRSVWRRLNPQQRRVLRMWANGMAWHEIAESLGITSYAVFERRKEIIARFKEQHEDALFTVVPPGILRSQQAHPVAWTMGIMATLAIVLWLIGMDGNGDSLPPPGPALAESPVDDVELARRGSGRRTPEPAPPPLPTATVVAAAATVETPDPRSDTNDAASAIAAVPKPRPGKQSRSTRGTAAGEVPIVDAPSVPATKTTSLLEQELELIDDARSAIHRKDYATAEMLLEEHAHRFPQGSTAKDREKLRVRILCSLGRPAEADIVRRDLETHHDPGPLRCDVPRRSKTSTQGTHTR